MNFNPQTAVKRRILRGRRYVRCFWCRSVLSRQETTLDHVISLRRGGSPDDDNVVTSCRKCNHERSLIQSLAASALLLEHRLLVRLGRFTGGWFEWHQKREDCLEPMLKWERLYHELLTGQQLDECLAEIDEVLGV